MRIRETILCAALLLAGTLSRAIEVDYGPDWQVKIDQIDSTVTQGKTTVKLTVYPVEADVEYKLLEQDKFQKLKRSNNSEFIIVDLDSGRYQFRISQQGYYTVEYQAIMRSQHFYEAQVNLRYPRNIQTRKPAIYMYGEPGLKMSLEVNPIGQFNFVHPQMVDNKWEIELGENGKINIDEKSFDYLFWEGEQNELFIDRTSGFVIEGESAIEFLEEKLTNLGLNEKERNDFIVYWAPELTKDENSFIHFVVNDDYDQQIASINSSEPIETSIRIFMYYEPCEAFRVASPQTLTSISRKGLTLVEWGGGSFIESDLKTN